jgi:hypothetical protein
MHELASVLLVVSFAYCAAAIGLTAALLCRCWTRRGERLPSVGEAVWCAFLPPVAVLLLPLFAIHPHPSQAMDAIHVWWHGMERAIHAAPLAHGSLHAANALLLLTALAGMGRAVFTLTRSRAFMTTVHAAATPEAGLVDDIPLFSLPSSRFVCFTMGLRRPAIYISSSLRAELTPRDLEAMIAHEAAHVRRRDSAVRAVLHFFYALFPLPGSRRLLADWQRAVERDCDAEAALRIGSAPDVAAALIRAAQATARGRAPMPAGVSFVAAEDDIEGRVTALLAPAVSRPRGLPALLVFLGLAFLQSTGGWVHHLVELFVRH